MANGAYIVCARRFLKKEYWRSVKREIGNTLSIDLMRALNFNHCNFSITKACQNNLSRFEWLRLFYVSFISPKQAVHLRSHLAFGLKSMCISIKNLNFIALLWLICTLSCSMTKTLILKCNGYGKELRSLRGPWNLRNRICLIMWIEIRNFV